MEDDAVGRDVLDHINLALLLADGLRTSTEACLRSLLTM
jgi:hypothetical protein